MNATTSVGTRKADAPSTTDKAPSPIENEAQPIQPSAPKGSIFDPSGGRPLRLHDEQGYPKGPDRMSPSLITLTVRPLGEYFEGHRVPKAQDAGFTWTGIRAKHLGILSRDEELPLAVMEVVGAKEAFGQLKLVEILFDPESSAIEYRAGSRIIKASADFAARAAGTLCDGLGNVLGADALEALATHVDGVMSRRMDESRAAPVEMPDGTLRAPLHLSFQFEQRRKTRNGSSYERHVYFDAPALPYHAGRARGLAMGLEMVKFIKSHKVLDPYVGATLAEAMGVRRVWGNYDKDTRDNVAAGFMEVMEALISVGARHANEPWIVKRIERVNAEGVEWAEMLADQKRDFVERMRAAKAAKKAAQKGDAS